MEKNKIKKSVLYCNEFKHGDQYMKNALDGHPKTGGLYKKITDEKGMHYIEIPVNGTIHVIFISANKGKDPRYSYDFIDLGDGYEILNMKFMPFNMYGESLSEWLDNDEGFSMDYDEDDATELEDSDGLEINVEKIVEDVVGDFDELQLIQEIANDILCEAYQKDAKLAESLAENMMDLLNEYIDPIHDQKNLDLDDLIEIYKQDRDESILHSIQLAILNKLYNREQDENEEDED
jgi:hypothetical protein